MAASEKLKGGRQGVQRQIQRCAELYVGRHYQAAFDLASEALARAPRHPILLNIAGMAAYATRRLADAERLYQAAIAQDVGYAEAIDNLARLLFETGRTDEALALSERVLALRPGQVDALFRIAAINEARGDTAASVASLRQIAATAPGHVPACYALARLLLTGAGEAAEAGDLFERVLAAEPTHVGALCGLACVRQRGGRLDEALALCQRAIGLAPAFGPAYNDLGSILSAMGRTVEAIAAFRSAVELAPGLAEAHDNLGNLLVASEDAFEEGEACLRQALALRPQLVSAHVNLGVLLWETSREAQAEAAYRRALEIEPQNTLARYNLGMCLLSVGRYEEGWPLHESRLQPAVEPRLSQQDFRTTIPRWAGEPLAGKSILVVAEQGFGDDLQFCRLLPLLAQRMQARVTFLARPALLPLLQGLDGIDVTDSLAPLPDRHYDCWVQLMSLPMWLGLTLGNLPAALPYLAAPGERVALWQRRLSGDGVRVGLVWRGNPKHRNDRHRSLPSLATLAPLWAVPGVQFFSLQKGDGADEGRRPPPHQPLTHLGDELADFADTAAVVETLDLVICVDTAVAHLAGALARPCWVMLPRVGTDWRWLRSGCDTAWYPRALRLFRQPRPGDWQSVVEEMQSALSALVATGNARGGDAREVDA
jgi:tetratricopeptide (TPR) repeat protein